MLKCSFPFYGGGFGIKQNNGRFLIFGGYIADPHITRTNLIIEITVNENEPEPSIEICYKNQRQLPFPEGFWVDQAFQLNGKLYTLQNVYNSQTHFFFFNQMLLLEISENCEIFGLGKAQQDLN